MSEASDSSKEEEIKIDYIETPHGSVPTLKGVVRALNEHYAYFGEVEKYLDQHEQRLNDVEGRVGQLESKVTSVARYAGSLDEDFKSAILAEIRTLDERVRRIEETLSELTEELEVLAYAVDLLERIMKKLG
ncbi:MAG: hypothetical protein NZ957_03830 [Thaumarchaeota archaeon]|nr:hypothetical protein [Candidatus Calditenuaceae archaeon]MDW8041788.1 hypothetical protein [Nitrososphaerota archaeon]